MINNSGFSSNERPKTTDWEEHSAVADLSTGRRFKAIQEVPNKIAVDEYSDTVSYVGETKPGIGVSEAFWRIKRITITGAETIVEFADGKDSFTSKWSDRLTITYS